MQEKYLTLIQEQEAVLKKNNRVFNAVGYIKLVLVLLIIFLLYLMVVKQFPLALIVLSVSVLIALVFFWGYHDTLEEKIRYAKGMISICSRHIDRITGKWAAFEDTGAEFADPGHLYACDLDVVGQNSLFQMLNTTHTWHGRRSFANDLLCPAYLPPELQKRQETVAELSGDVDFSNRVQFYLSQIKADPSLTDTLTNNTPFIKSGPVRVILTFAPVFTLAFILGIVLLRQNNLYPAGAFVLALQMTVWIAGIGKLRKYLGVITGLLYKLSAYNDIVDTITGHVFSSQKLRQIQGDLREAAGAVKDLSKIADKISIRHNGLLYFLANVLLLWDYECAFWLQEWKRKHARQAEGWFVAIGEFESLLSLSHLPNVGGKTCRPMILENENTLQAEGLGHPLLPNETRIANDIAIHNNILIISGSNMSGKTTFLRTVGINLALARAGGFVCADTMSCSLFEIATSMRIADNLNQGVSTFYAELKRIKRIIDYAQERSNSLFLIDEIFKGTNSADRLAGAKAVLAKLHDLRVTGLVSTHDLELCDLADAYAKIKNYNFSEQYQNNKICFDYKLRHGKSNTTNAKYLMEMVGIFERR